MGRTCVLYWWIKETTWNIKNNEDNIKLDFRETGCVDVNWAELD
jgi:hypothetical protein